VYLWPLNAAGVRQRRARPLMVRIGILVTILPVGGALLAPCAMIR